MVAPRLQNPSQENATSAIPNAVRTNKAEPAKAMAEKTRTTRSAREVKIPESVTLFGLALPRHAVGYSKKKAPSWVENTNSTMIQTVEADTASLRVKRGRAIYTNHMTAGKTLGASQLP